MRSVVCPACGKASAPEDLRDGACPSCGTGGLGRTASQRAILRQSLGDEASFAALDAGLSGLETHVPAPEPGAGLATHVPAPEPGAGVFDTAAPLPTGIFETRDPLPAGGAARVPPATTASGVEIPDDPDERLRMARATYAGASRPDPLRETQPSSLPGDTPEELVRRAEAEGAGEGDPAAIRRVSRMWSTAVGVGVPVRTSLKSSGLAPAGSARVTIRPRLIHDPKRPAPKGKESADAADYELVKMLGEGGMGIVYAARQTSVDRQIALKMLKTSTRDDGGARAKFLAEAAVTGELDHPNIVPIHDLGMDAQGALFYAMKWVRGKPWVDVLGQKSRRENLEILMRVADAIRFAHARGVIHRDLKPENVMIGDFGEVVVMDWGLAAGVGVESKAPPLSGPEANGGTPAYMAPEMAAGPVERIGTWSDVYLLGAILWEIITGNPPHDGQSVLKCLFAAGQNRIVPTKERGELVEIALKAMATVPEDRHPNVEAFQQAVREHLSHEESELLTLRAEERFRTALESHVYDDYAQALFGMRQALELWPQNGAAAAAVPEIQLAYAEDASAKGDYDLALSLLGDSDRPDHRDLRKKIERSANDRRIREQRFKVLRVVVAGLSAATILIVGAAAIIINNARGRAETARAQAEIAQQEEASARRAAVLEKDRAEVERRRAEDQREKAELARQQAEAAQAKEVQAKVAERQQRIAAEQARHQEKLAKEQESAAREKAVAAEARAVYEGYVAKVGLASAKIAENSFRLAVFLLDGSDVKHRSWEWGRLRHLCGLDDGTYLDHDQRVDAVAYGTVDGQAVLASAGWDGRITIHDPKTLAAIRGFDHPPMVRALAIAPQGNVLASGGDDGLVRLWDIATGEELRSLTGHRGAVLGLRFSPDGKRLLSTADDDTARLWNPLDGKTLLALAGHNQRVWSGDISADGTRAVTAGEDGRVILWRLSPMNADEEEEQPVLPPDSPVAGLPRGPILQQQQVHLGAVRAAIFGPQGKVLTAGDDKLIRVWGSDLTKLEREWGAHPAVVRALSVAPDGVRLASAGNDNTVRVWHLQEGTPLATLRGHSGSVTSVVWLGEGDRLASASEDRSVKAWNAATYREVVTIEGHADAVFAGNFSADGTRIVTAGRDAVARVVDFRSGRTLAVLEEGHRSPIMQVQMSADGALAVTAARDGTIRVWNPVSGEQLRSVSLGSEIPTATALAHDGGDFLVGDERGFVHRFSLGTGELLKSYKQHVRPITALAWSQDDKRFVSGDDTGLALVWRIDQPKAVTKYPETHNQKITGAVFFPDGKRIATVSLDRTASIWDADTGAELLSFAHRNPTGGFGVRCVALSADGKRLITGADDGRLRIWDIPARQLEFELSAGSKTLLSVALSAHGTTALSADLDGEVKLWDLQTRKAVDFRPGQKLGRFVGLAADGKTAIVANDNVAAHWQLDGGTLSAVMAPHGLITGASFLGDSDTVVTAGFDGAIKVWQVSKERVLRKKLAHQQRINGLATRQPRTAPDGTAIPALLATAADDRTVRLWNPATLDLVLELPPHPDRVFGVCFSPDGTRVATACADGCGRLFAVADGTLLQTYSRHRWWMKAVLFSPDGTRLFTAGADNDVRVWDTASGKSLRVLEGHNDGVNGLAVSPDGARLFSGSADTSIRVWDWEEGGEVLSLTEPRQDVTSVAVSPDGRWVMGTSRDRTTVLWQADDWAVPQPPPIPPKAAEAEPQSRESAAASPRGGRGGSGFGEGR